MIKHALYILTSFSIFIYNLTVTYMLLTILQMYSLKSLLHDDMYTYNGIRSVSNLDPRYNNDNIIIPYSNWRGPIWINVNSIMAYTYAAQDRKDIAINIADNIVHMLADDLRVTNAWHESYNSINGTGLAAPGFLSWNTLSASLHDNILHNINPLEL